MPAKKTVMIVDDRYEMVSTLTDVLEDYGYTVVAAHDGYQALQCLRQSPVNLALIDIMMPGINGIETFKEIKRLFPTTAVIMMTAFAVEDLVKEAIREGAYAVVYKPFDLKQLITLIADSLSGPTVLIVDDQQPLGENLMDILTSRGYRVTAVTDGQSAIHKIKEGQYDVILLDIVMPGLNGEQTFLEIKKVNPRASVVMYSGYAVEDVIKRCVENGAYTCLHKPFSPERIIQIIEEVMAQKKNGHT
jgi:DNA-binding NtrC family response regulator